MLRRALAAALALSLFALAMAPRLDGAKKPKTGEVDDNMYQDLRFGFSIQFPDDWKIGKPKKEYTPQRLIAEQKNPRVPIRLRSDPDWATKPTVLIFADSTDMAPQVFFNFLQSDSGKSEFKNKILSKSVLLHRLSNYSLEILASNVLDLLEVKALKLTGRMQYDAQVQVPGRSQMELVRDFRSGYIYLVPFEGWLLYIELVCENQFRQAFEETFETMIASLSFGTEAEETKKSEETEPAEE